MRNFQNVKKKFLRDNVLDIIATSGNEFPMFMLIVNQINLESEARELLTYMKGIRVTIVINI